MARPLLGGASLNERTGTMDSAGDPVPIAILGFGHRTTPWVKEYVREKKPLEAACGCDCWDLRSIMSDKLGSDRVQQGRFSIFKNKGCGFYASKRELR